MCKEIGHTSSQYKNNLTIRHNDQTIQNNANETCESGKYYIDDDIGD